MPSPYGVLLAVLVVLIYTSPNLLVVAFGGLSSAAGVVERPSSPELIFGLVLTLVLQLVVLLLALVPLLFTARPYSRLLGTTRTSAALVAVALGLGVAVTVVTYVLNAVLVVTLGEREPVEQQLLEDALSGTGPLVLAVLLAVVLAPVAEEVVFRGVLFRALAGRLGPAVGAVLSAAVFAGIHFEVVVSQPVALVGLFVIGIVLAVGFHLTGSLLVPILAHAVYNGLSLLLAVLIDRIGLDGTEVVALAGRVLGGG